MYNDEINWQGKTILIVEDNVSNYELLATFLKKTGAEIMWVKDGGDAVEACKNNSIDLVLMDIQLKKMNGFEATKQIKAINSNIPVVAQTAFAMVGDREKCLAAGCDDYLSKPIRKSVFFHTISKFIR